jgi:multicomponent Na+:H+ antiporter subunit B
MTSFAILRVAAKLLIPYILLFALYVQFHGDYGPGGGFQAGVIFAAGIILYGLVFGLQAAQRVVPPRLIEVLIPLGVLIYGGTGVVSLLAGGHYLEYTVLEHHWGAGQLPHGQHLGIFLVESGVGVTVATVMIAIFYLFAARGQNG